MKKTTVVKAIMTTLISTVILSVVTMSEAKTVTFYCPATTAIQFQPNTDSWAPYLYTSPHSAVVSANSPVGWQLALTGKGASAKVVQFISAVWSDGELLCNYDGLTDASAPDMMVLYSKRLGPSPTCHFVQGSECLSNDPKACPMLCDLRS